MNIWTCEDLTGLNWHQQEPDVSFFESSRTNETVPDENAVILPLEPTKIKVYSQYQPICDHLKDPAFEIVDEKENADILWLTTHFKTFKEFSHEYPGRRINQFPFEHVFTIKDLLCVVCRRMAKEGENQPEWLPTTFNLKTELAQFVSYFQHRQSQGLDNHYIIKPWNLARGLDIHVTKSLHHILKLSLSGPKSENNFNLALKKKKTFLSLFDMHMCLFYSQLYKNIYTIQCSLKDQKLVRSNLIFVIFCC